MDIDIIGTPDEEAMGQGGYVQCRVFKEYDFAIMVHLDEETRPNHNSGTSTASVLSR